MNNSTPLLITDRKLFHVIYFFVISLFFCSASLCSAMENLEQLYEDLNSSDPDIRVNAARALGQTGDVSVVPTLISQGFNDSFWQVRDAAAKSVAEIGEPAVDFLIHALSSDKIWIRFKAQDALVLIGKPAIDTLVQALESAPLPARWHIAETLGRIPDYRVLRSLIRAQKDRISLVRTAADEALKKVREFPSVIFIQALGDPDLSVRNFSIFTLVSREESSIQHLIDAVASENPLVRASAIYGLALLRASIVSETIIDLLLNDPDPQVRIEAAKFLGKLQVHEAAGTLLETLVNDSNSDVKSEAILVLGKLKDLTAVKPLLKNYSDTSLIHDVIYALQMMGKSAVDRVVEILKNDPDPEMRRNAAAALAYLGRNTLTGKDALIRALSDSSEMVRSASSLSMAFREDTEIVTYLLRKLIREEIETSFFLKILKLTGEIGIDALVHQLGSSDIDIREKTFQLLEHLSQRGIEALIRGCRHSDERVRMHSVEALVHVGEPVIASLIQALQDSEKEVRFCAANALGRIGGPVIEPLIAAFPSFEDNDNIREELGTIFNRIGKPAVQPLIDVLNHDNWKVCLFAIIGLGSIEDDRSLEPLMSALDDSEAKIRIAAANSIGNLSNPKVIEKLIQTLNDPDLNVAMFAMIALAHIGFYNDAEKKLELEQLEKLKEDQTWSVRAGAALVLGGMKNERVLQTISDLLSHSKRFVRERSAVAFFLLERQGLPVIDLLIENLNSSNHLVQSWSVYALDLIGNPRAIKSLIKLRKKLEAQKSVVNDDVDEGEKSSSEEDIISSLILMLERLDSPESRISSALGKLTGEDKINELVKELTHNEDSDMRAYAALQLGYHDDPHTIPHLIIALGDPVEKVRLNTANALKEFEHFATKPLITALDSREVYVRSYAARILGELKEPTAAEKLIPLLGDPYFSVVANASKALLEIGMPAIDLLEKARDSDDDIIIQKWARNIVGAIQSRK